VFHRNTFDYRWLFESLLNAWSPTLRPSARAFGLELLKGLGHGHQLGGDSGDQLGREKALPEREPARLTNHPLEATRAHALDEQGSRSPLAKPVLSGSSLHRRCSICSAAPVLAAPVESQVRACWVRRLYRQDRTELVGFLPRCFRNIHMIFLSLS
jgi:hypothetical protein